MLGCVPAACASLRLAPACITTVDLARRCQLHALSSAGESAVNSPWLLVTRLSWLLDAAADAAPAPCVVTFLQPLAVPRRRHRYAARCRAVRDRGDDLNPNTRERPCALVALATLATHRRRHRRLCHPCHCISLGTARAVCTVVTEPRRHSPPVLFSRRVAEVLSAAVLSRERQGKGRRAVGPLQRGAEDLRSRAHPPGTETRKSLPRAGREACTPSRATRGRVRKDTRCNDQRTEERGPAWPDPPPDPPKWRIWVSIPVEDECEKTRGATEDPKWRIWVSIPVPPRTPMREGILRNTVRPRNGKWSS